jgi:uncharacterized protein (TIGR02687 family)
MSGHVNASMKRIHDSLGRVFEQHRIVFWYDATEEWTETYSHFTDEKVVKLTVANNEFGTKVRIVRDSDPATRFLVYIPSARPADADNWLLDLLLQGFEYRADKAALALQEVGLPHEFLELAEEHAKFFQSENRITALKDLLAKDDQARDVRLKMMAVLLGTAVEVDAFLLQFLSEPQDQDPPSTHFGSAALVMPFWREVERAFGYSSETPALREFVVLLFRGANPLDKKVPLHPHAKVFLQRWKDSQAYRESFRTWAGQMERELHVEVTLEECGERAPVGDCDTFEIFEKFALHRICKAFEMGTAAVDVTALIQERRTSFWQPLHAHGYVAVEQALTLRELLAGTELAIDSVETGLGRYTNTWWKIDTAYRLCIWNLRNYGNTGLMTHISQWAEKAYLNRFLLPLADLWGDQVRRLASWDCEGVLLQRRFFINHVQPFLDKGLKVFVIISDALRYEAAVDFAQRLRSANRWTAEVSAMFGSLPSYTQLGMASLLPGTDLAIDPATATVTVDGRSASGTENRAEILRAATNGKATAIQAEDFMNLNSKTDGRALMRDHEVVYIFHNAIDKTGDAISTEGETFEAVEKTFSKLEEIIKKVANINGSNMLLTADHGFLFQQNEMDEADMTALPAAQEWLYRGRRFALGKEIEPASSIKVFDCATLRLGGNWSVAFPYSLGRFPLSGSGKRFVHGGISLQEIVVPVVKIHKARADDTGIVEVELVRVPPKITTGQLAIALFQDKPAIEKTLPRTLRIGIFAKDGTAISESKTYIFDSKDAEARNREVSMVLVLSHAADSFNNTEVDLRLEKVVHGTNQFVTYKTHSLKLQKPFTSDFDEH